jgi:hypothetical protein
MLLKVTHLPFVGAIWVFESLHEQLNGGASKFSSIGPGYNHPTNDPAMPFKRQRPFLHNRTTAEIGARYSMEIPNDENPVAPSPQNSAAKVKNDSDPVVVVSNIELENQVRELTAKITELTALFMAQQGAAHEDYL